MNLHERVGGGVRWREKAEEGEGKAEGEGEHLKGRGLGKLGPESGCQSPRAASVESGCVL